MQNSFLSTIVNYLLTNMENNSNIIVLPSKRAIIFIKEELKKQLKSNYLFPEIITMEDLLFKITKKNKINNIHLLFEFFKIYIDNTTDHPKQDFKQFSSWVNTALNDFNEIDQNLIDSEKFLNYLADVNRMEKWNLENNSNKISKNYFNFLQSLKIYYNKLKEILKNKNLLTTGLLYREAVLHIENYIAKNNNHIFIGFNGLNTAEIKIIETLLKNNQTKIIFDVDLYFNHKIKSYGYFINQIAEKWNKYNKHIIFMESKFNSTKKNIHYYGSPKDITQSKLIGELLEKKLPNKNTVVVLGNEDLIAPLIHSIPNNVENMNITMGLSLKNNDILKVINYLFQIHLKNNTKIYFKDLFELLKSKPIQTLIKDKEELKKIILNTNKNNQQYISNVDQIKHLFEIEHFQLVENLIKINQKPSNLIQHILPLLNYLKEKEFENINILTQIENIFLNLEKLLQKYPYIKTIEDLYYLFNQHINNEELSFKGDPFNGVQIMGLLETRLLDYKNIVIASCNEGFLPTSSNNTSFIPFDLKIEYDIPTFKDKDAIFTYHFFRAIQRAKNIHLIYNTENNSFGSGEKSRFIKQLEYLTKDEKNITSTHINVQTINKPDHSIPLNIEKNKDIISALESEAKKGISPSTLLNYINNPIKFYKQKIAKIKEVDLVEEIIAPNTFGNIIHKSLEEQYLTYLNKILSVKNIKTIQKNIPKTILKYFKKEFKSGDFSVGKNKLMFEVAKEQVQLFLKKEVNLVKNNSAKVIGLEKEINIIIEVDFSPYQLKLRGNIDRIDCINDVYRIIDYKTGKVEQNHLKITNWEDVITDYDKYAKSFQVLFYAYIYCKKNKIDLDKTKLETGIISFKNINSNFISFNKGLITKETLTQFEKQLFILLEEIYNPNFAFIQNENARY